MFYFILFEVVGWSWFLGSAKVVAKQFWKFLYLKKSRKVPDVGGFSYLFWTKNAEKSLRSLVFPNTHYFIDFNVFSNDLIGNIELRRRKVPLKPDNIYCKTCISVFKNKSCVVTKRRNVVLPSGNCT